MARNLNRINNYYQRQAAWEDWEYIAERATAAGREDLVRHCQPCQSASTKKIDRSIAAVRTLLHWPEVWQMREQERSVAGAEVGAVAGLGQGDATLELPGGARGHGPATIDTP